MQHTKSLWLGVVTACMFGLVWTGLYYVLWREFTLSGMVGGIAWFAMWFVLHRRLK